MLEAEYLLFVSDRTVDERGRSNLIGVCENIYTDNVPTRVLGLKAVARIVPTKKAIVDKELKIKLSGNINGKEVFKLEASPKATIELGNGMSPAFDLSEAIFPEFGIYTIKLFVDNKELIKRTFSVKDKADLTEK